MFSLEHVVEGSEPSRHLRCRRDAAALRRRAQLDEGWEAVRVDGGSMTGHPVAAAPRMPWVCPGRRRYWASSKINCTTCALGCNIVAMKVTSMQRWW